MDSIIYYALLKKLISETEGDIEDVSNRLDAIAADLADPFDSAVTYNKGDLILKDDKLLVCIAEHSAQGNFDPADWEEVSLKELFASKADLENGKVPASQLPSYVDDVFEYPSLNDFPAEGETGKIYVALDSNLTYRWSGSSYIQIGGASLAAGNGILLNNDVISADTEYLNENLNFATPEALSAKQDVISDLDSIRSGAEAGATAVQPADITQYVTADEVNTMIDDKITSALNAVY